MREYNKKNPEKSRQINKKYKKTRNYKNSAYKYLYKITLDEYENLYFLQNGKCKICYKEKEMRKLCVDHDHSTGKIRGLLCDTCNRGLGYFKDNPLFLKNAIKYLER